MTSELAPDHDDTDHDDTNREDPAGDDAQEWFSLPRLDDLDDPAGAESGVDDLSLTDALHDALLEARRHATAAAPADLHDVADPADPADPATTAGSEHSERSDPVAPAAAVGIVLAVMTVVMAVASIVAANRFDVSSLVDSSVISPTETPVDADGADEPDGADGPDGTGEPAAQPTEDAPVTEHGEEAPATHLDPGGVDLTELTELAEQPEPAAAPHSPMPSPAQPR